MCAGSVIHATGEQDIRRMGVYIKITHHLCSNALASLSLVGFLFLVVFIERFSS
jgi:NADH:ubiquinone oxidoreductase subunit 5 (subunit L)/multisubunit Na+/H+ antiporter MnhA subunit